MLARARDDGRQHGGGTAAANHVADFFLAAPRCAALFQVRGWFLPWFSSVCCCALRVAVLPCNMCLHQLCGFSSRYVELSNNSVVGGSDSFDEISTAVT